ncbi:MAG: GNAT family N-acetyltransferase [Bacteroidales bacterium]
MDNFAVPRNEKMLEIKTQNLVLLALDYESLCLLKKDRILLENHLELNFADHQLSEEIKTEIKNDLKFRIDDVLENPAHFEWYTFWEIILKSQHISIGGIALSGYPDHTGTTSISYFIDKRQRGKGYATEAVTAMTGWAFRNEKLKTIHALSPSKNKNSQRVLQKCGFIKGKSNADIINWELKRETTI